MIKIILLDCDGVIVKRDKYFSQRVKIDFGIDLNNPPEKSFFKNEFIQCELGKLDLKEELSKQIPKWGINWTVEEALKYWFEGEKELDNNVVETILALRKNGVKCYLSTNNEKYRTEYLKQEVGLGNILDGVFSCADLGYMKPDLNFWQEIYKNFTQVKKDEILVFDNKQAIVDSAVQFGFNAELYTGFDNFIKQLEKYKLTK